MRELLVTSTVLILALSIIRLVLKGRISLRVQYALWSLVLLRLLIPVTPVHSPISVLNTIGPVAPVLVEREPFPAPVTGINTESPIILDVPAVGDISQSTVGENSSTLPLFPVFWLAGASLLGIWLLGTNLSFGNRLRRSSQFFENNFSPIPIYVTESISSPCLAGLFRPSIYLTPDCLENEVRLHHIVTHELTHYRHRDHVWSAARCLVLCLYWFDPFVWLAALLSRRDCELACDEGTLLQLGAEERVAYGRTLLSMVALRAVPVDFFHTATAMCSGKRGLKERIKLIAKQPKMLTVTFIAVLLLTVVMVGCTFTGAAQPEVTPEPTLSAQPQVEHSEELPSSEETNTPVYEGIDFLSGFYGNDTASMDGQIKLVNGSITDGTYTVKVEGVIAYPNHTVMGLSIHAEHAQALTEPIADTERPKYISLLGFTNEEHAKTGGSVMFQNLQPYNTEDTIYLGIRLVGVTAPFKLFFRELGLEGPSLDISVEPIEGLNITPQLSDSPKWDYNVSQITLTPLSFEMDVAFSEVLRGGAPHLPFYFRMADGSIQTPTQFFKDNLNEGRYGHLWMTIGMLRENADGTCVYRYSAPTKGLLDYLSVKGVIVQDIEYSFADTEMATPVEVDETITPFLVPNIELGENFYFPAKEVCRHLGAKLVVNTNEKTASITYRTITVELTSGVATATVNGTPTRLDLAPVLQDGKLLINMDVLNTLQVGAMRYYLMAEDTNQWLITP